MGQVALGRLTENSVLVMKNRSYTVTAEIKVPKTGAQGVIVAQGGGANGWSLYAKDGKLKYCYNLLGVKLTFIEGTRKIPSGKHQVRVEFKYDGGDLANGGAVSLYVDGEKDGEGRLGMAIPMMYSGEETCSVGKDEGSPVSPDYGQHGNGFTGTVNWVRFDLEEDDHNH
jgi:hypothetical protein